MAEDNVKILLNAAQIDYDAIQEAVNSYDATSLNLRNTVPTEEAATQIAQALFLSEQSKITELVLADNPDSFGDEVIAKLAEALETHHSFTTVNLSNTGIADEGAAAIAKALKSAANITSLDLSTNDIGYEGATALSEALQGNTTLTYLNLARNPLGDAGAEVLAKALASNSTITSLDMTETDLGDDGISSFITLFTKENTTLLDFKFECNWNAMEDAIEGLDSIVKRRKRVAAQQQVEQEDSAETESTE